MATINKKAFVTGTTGQDASYLIELLLKKDYEVHGLVRRSSYGYGNLRNIIHLVNDPDIYHSRFWIHSGDMADTTSLYRIISEVKPDEIYNLAAQADVQESFFQPEYSLDINGAGVLRLLEVMRQIVPRAKFYQASTSELFGNADEFPQKETTKMNPQSPYAIGKLAGYHAVRKYREMYGIFASNGILFNHESPRRGDDYVTRKITKGLARIKMGKQKELRLGNLHAKRDWGYAKEYMEAAWMILQNSKSDDFVIGTGETHTIDEWLTEALSLTGVDRNTIIIDSKFYRPAEVYELCADYSKAKNVLGWEPKVRFNELVRMMVEADLHDI